MANKNVVIVIVLLFLIALLAFFNKNLLAITFDDSLCYNCGFDWETSNNWIVEREGMIDQKVLSNGDWFFGFGAGQKVKLVSKKSFDNEDARFLFSNTNDYRNIARNTLCSVVSAHVQVGNCGFDVLGGSTGVIYNRKNSFVEVITSRVDNSRFEVLLDGEKKCEGVGSKKIEISRPIVSSVGCSGSLELKSLRYRPLFGCTMNDGESLALETFVAGNKVDINSFRYDVKRFCLAHPVIITDEVVGGSDSSAEPYDVLVRADSAGVPRSVTVPQGQTYTFFYIFNYKNAGINVVCGSDEAFNTKTGECRNAKGIISFCSSGQYDSARNACIVTASPACEKGSFVNNECVYYLPTQTVCSAGGFNTVTQKCEVDEQVCSSQGFVFNPTTRVCEAFPLKIVQQSCDEIGGVERIVESVKQCVLRPSISCSAGFSKEKIDGVDVCVGVEQPSQLQKALFKIGSISITILNLFVGLIILVLLFFVVKLLNKRS